MSGNSFTFSLWFHTGKFSNEPQCFKRIHVGAVNPFTGQKSRGFWHMVQWVEKAREEKVCLLGQRSKMDWQRWLLILTAAIVWGKIWKQNSTLERTSRQRISSLLQVNHQFMFVSQQIAVCLWSCPQPVMHSTAGYRSWFSPKMSNSSCSWSNWGQIMFIRNETKQTRVRL